MRAAARPLGETGLDQERTEERLHGPLTLGLAALAEKPVQLVEIGHSGHGGGQAALHGLDGPLGVGLLVAPRGHAATGVEDVVTGQRGVSRVELTFAPFEDQRGDRFGVVPTRPLLANVPKNSKAATMPWRIASVRSHGRAITKGAFE